MMYVNRFIKKADPLGSALRVRLTKMMLLCSSNPEITTNGKAVN